MAPATTLLLFPTEAERRACAPAFAGRSGVRAELCGFGPLSSAARTAGLVAAAPPQRVVLAGIAGALDPSLELGSAHWFRAAGIDGVGAGEGAELLSPAALGLPQWPGAAGGLWGPQIDDHLELWVPPRVAARGQLLTVTAAAGSAAQADHRRTRFPDAAAEEMEAFGAGLACALAGIEFGCVRGISNLAGERAREGWRIAPALEAVSGELTRLLDLHP